MAAASSFAPLLTRIKEVLCDGQGAARTIAAANRFSDKVAPNEPLEGAASQAHGKKTVWAFISDKTPRDNNRAPMSIAKYEVTVTILCNYFLGSVYQPSELRAAVALAADDSHRIVNALQYAGNLTQTEAAAATGLASGMLVWQRTRQTEPDFEHGIFVQTLEFNGYVEVTNPS